MRAGIELLAVDLDGTLIDSAPDIAHCLGLALESLGFVAPGEVRARDWIGDGVETLIERALVHALAARGNTAQNAQELHSAALREFLARYAENLFVRSRLYPGVAETLDLLRARDVRLCCITNKRIAFSEPLLELAGIRDRFELVIGGDSLPQKKPSPLPLNVAAATLGVASSAAALVGDSIHDARAARAAGWSFIWATFGYCVIPQVEVGTSASIERFADLAALVRP